MTQQITTGERARLKQAVLDFRDGRGERDVDMFVDDLLATLELAREERPVTGQSATVDNENEGSQS